MDDGNAVSKRRIGAMELLSIGGFACFFGWMLVSFYWLFAEYIQDVSIAERDVVQMFVFAGLVLGYFVLYLAGKNKRFDLFKIKWLATTAVLSMLLPLAAVVLDFGMTIPSAALCVVNLCAGIGGAVLTVSWLDVCSRIRLQSFRRFTSLSLVGGGILFTLVAMVPNRVQPAFCIIYALLSVGLLHFVSARGGSATCAPPIGSCKKTWEFAWEIEPSLIAFGIVFGLTFVYLFNSGIDTVLVGLLFVIPGAGIIAAFALRGKNIGITVIQRILLCVTVLSCLAMPFADKWVQLACSCLVVASWAAFVSVNYALVVKKSVENWGAPVFRQVPVRLIFSALGFLLGWAIAATMTVIYGAHSDAFMIVRLCMAFVLVVVVMLFFPSPERHDRPAAAAGREAKPVVSSNLSDRELFERRCKDVAELYQLSPRETDILEFLAKGRNAAYIQSKLTISPHTVKSHIYSIYRKLDIHSQQKLMDFVEEYPIEATD
ncbi:MAG: helix-turn-helix transcriptional regulator [Gordonibacter sp.]|uniref:helix-turn-helix transcriptional regulator n=1 Tax=Gordonibacter sp. TaxID=1968902 RepID=UPI002FCB24A5